MISEDDLKAISGWLWEQPVAIPKATPEPYQFEALEKISQTLAKSDRAFNWAIARGIYGIDRSPCDCLRPAAVIGKKLARQRVLNEGGTESGMVSNEPAAGIDGPLLRLLILTGQRKSEVAEARWSEFDLKKSYGQSLPIA